MRADELAAADTGKVVRVEFTSDTGGDRAAGALYDLIWGHEEWFTIFAGDRPVSRERITGRSPALSPEEGLADWEIELINAPHSISCSPLVPDGIAAINDFLAAHTGSVAHVAVKDY